MERTVGADSSTTVHRIVDALRRNLQEQRPLSARERLDAPGGDDGRARHELIEAVTPERRAAEDREAPLHGRRDAALAPWPPHDRAGITVRGAGVPGVEIARRMPRSPVTSTRIAPRVVERRRRIVTVEED